MSLWTNEISRDLDFGCVSAGYPILHSTPANIQSFYPESILNWSKKFLVCRKRFSLPTNLSLCSENGGHIAVLYVKYGSLYDYRGIRKMKFLLQAARLRQISKGFTMGPCSCFLHRKSARGHVQYRISAKKRTLNPNLVKSRLPKTYCSIT